MQHIYEGADALRQELPGRAGARDELEADVADTQWRFNLRKNVKFHDGSAVHRRRRGVLLRAASSSRRARCRSTSPASRRSKKVDDHTVDFILAGPNPVLLRNIVDFRIMSKAWSEKNTLGERAGLPRQGRDLRLAQHQRHRPVHAQGAGSPTSRSSFAAEHGLVGQARRQRHRRDLHADQVRRHARPALLSGDVDLVTDLPTQDVARLRKERQAQGARRRTRSAPSSSAWTSTTTS